MAALSIQQNVGTIDRVIRFAVGVGLVIYPAVAAWQAWAIALLAAIGGLQLLAGLTGY